MNHKIKNKKIKQKHMDDLHQKLMDKKGWYHFWHSQKGSQIAHWAVFALVGVLITTLVVGNIKPDWLRSGNEGQAAETLVSFPNANLEFLMGPQVKSGTSTAPGAAWFDQNAIDNGLKLCSEFPDAAHAPGNSLGVGTLTLTQGSNIVRGTGTRFLTDIPNNSNALAAFNGTYREAIYIAGTPQSDTQFTANGTWNHPTVTEEYYTINGDEFNNYQGYKNYYDFGLVSYINYYRTGDTRFLDCARKVTDSWWSSIPIDSGRNMVSVSSDSHAPRVASLTGLMLRAMDGRPEMWPWITDYVRYQENNWVEVPRGWWDVLTDGQIAGTEPRCEGGFGSNCDGGHFVTEPAGFYYGVRDGGYALLYAANLAKVHPDAAVRDEFRQKIVSAVHNYYARGQRLQYQNSPLNGGFYFNLDGINGMTTQPFQEGLLAEALIQVHHLTGDEITKNSIVQLAKHLYKSAYNPNGYRAMFYYVGGSFPNGYDCSVGCGGADPRNPWPPTDGSVVSESRQLNPTALHAFGYAYYLTGDSNFKTWGDDVFDASFSGADGYRSLAWGRGKEYDEGYRSSGRYLAWRLGSGVAPTPSPTTADTTAPTVTLASPTNGASVSGTITVSASASDNSGSVSKVEFLKDGLVFNSDFSAPFTTTLDTTTLTNADHNLSARAYDSSGNMGLSAAVKVTVNNTTVAVQPPSTSGLGLTFSGKNRDVVGRADTATSPDGTMDGQFVVSSAVSKTITALKLTRSAGGAWDTVPNTNWVLGAASSSGGSLLNAADASVNFPVSSGGTFYIFGGDSSSSYFNTGDAFALTATFSDGTQITATTTIGSSSTTSTSHLSLSPASVSFSALSNDPAPAAKTVTLSNTGSGTSSWNSSKTDDWCFVSPSSGSLAPGGSAALSVSVSQPDSQHIGTFPCTISLVDANADNSPQTIAVSYTVTAVVNNPTPAITSFSVTSKSAGTATVTWTTNQATTGTVKYGTVKTNLSLSASDNASQATHSVTLTGLTVKATYYYQITATNANGTTSTLISSFRTKPR
jgi:hypothetical protein